MYLPNTTQEHYRFGNPLGKNVAIIIIMAIAHVLGGNR
jgi:hypothetical protein